MRYTSWWFCLTIPMSILLPLDAALAAGAQPQPGMLRVPLDYPTIQEAIDAAAPGDELRQF